MHACDTLSVLCLYASHGSAILLTHPNKTPNRIQLFLQSHLFSQRKDVYREQWDEIISISDSGYWALCLGHILIIYSLWEHGAGDADHSGSLVNRLWEVSLYGLDWLRAYCVTSILTFYWNCMRNITSVIGIVWLM